MRVFVKVCCSGGGEPQAYALPCNEPTARVGSLKSLALDRWSENRGDNSKRDAEGFKLTLSGTGALLSDKDTIQDVLRDGEFLDLCEPLAARLAAPAAQAAHLATRNLPSAGPVGAPPVERDAGCMAKLPTYGLYPHTS